MEQVSETKFERVCAALARHDRDPSQLIAILSEIQDAYSYIPEDVIMYVAKILGVTPASVFGVATFYSHFTLEPKGKYVIKVCDGTACHVKKSEEIIKALQSELGLTNKKITSDDMLFTLEVVACVGACGLAPVVVINEDVYGSVTKDSIIDVVKKIRKEAPQNA